MLLRSSLVKEASSPQSVESLTSDGDWIAGLSHYGCQDPATEQAVILSNTEAKRFTEAEMVRPADVRAVIDL